MSKKGTGANTRASPPNKEQAPGVPNVLNICEANNGKPAPAKERKTVLILSADAALGERAKPTSSVLV